ncbi:hypothetical protein ACRV4U_002402 [Cronobacter sakazakii]
MLKRCSSLIVFSMLAAPLAQADTPRAVDVTAFDVAGVKTGMDYDQAVKAMTDHFHVPASALNVDKFPMMNPVTGNKQPQYVGYEKDGVELSVHFEGRVPVDPAHPLVVSMITYKLPWSTDNKTAMEKAALEKYGPQSNGTYTTPMVWCKNPGKMASDASSSDRNQATLELSNTSLELSDPSWSQARITFMESKQTRTPGF